MLSPFLFAIEILNLSRLTLSELTITPEREHALKKHEDAGAHSAGFNRWMRQANKSAHKPDNHRGYD